LSKPLIFHDRAKSGEKMAEKERQGETRKLGRMVFLLTIDCWRDFNPDPRSI